MQKQSAVLILSLFLVGCGGPKPPSDADALLALRHASFDGPIGEEMKRFAFMDANVLNCELGTRGEQSVSVCDVCVTLAGNEYSWVRDTGTTNRLQAAKAVIRVTLSNALSYDSPDVQPAKRNTGVWVASPVVSMSSDYETESKTYYMPPDLMARLDYPTSRPFSGLEEYGVMLRRLETPETSTAILSETGKCAAMKRKPGS